MYDRSTDLYDAIYLRMKDYEAESVKLGDILARTAPSARRILDVACGTGEHALHLRRRCGYAVDGVDLDGELLARAAVKNPEGRFVRGDMTTFDLGGTYDAVLCLFSAIGYVRTVDRLGAALRRFAAHVRPGGVVLVEPWFPPGVLDAGRIFVDTADDGDVRIVRMAYTEVEGRRSFTHFRYLVGRPGSITHEEETHELGLFTEEEMRAAFEEAGLVVEYEEGGLSGRGLYIGRRRGEVTEPSATKRGTR
ncbi:class I SAM-dependent methyltransferase [bacterium]|nr:class I SAM-dependent methyltransferase [bacterium]